MGSVAQTQVAGEPWERRQGESAKAYEAFCMYRDLGANRSHVKVAAALRKSSTLIGRWGGEHKWSERVGAWDRFLAEEQRKAHVEAVKKMEERHARLGEGMQTLAARKLQRMLERTDPNKSSKQEADAALDSIEMHDMRALIKDGTGLERVARGEPETITEERQVQTWADAVVQRRRERAEKEQAERKAQEQAEPGAVSEGAHDDADGGGSDD